MRGYVIRRLDHEGFWLAPSGGVMKSYTTNKAKARVFATQEEAEKELCPDNEVIEPLL